MSDNDGCTWCTAYEYATETLGYSDDAAANYARSQETNAARS